MARNDLASRTRNKCLKLLYRMCGHYALLPKAMQISVACDRTRHPSCGGAFGDVWKEKYNDGDVAVKVLKLYQTDFKGIRSVSFWLLPSSRVPIMSNVEVLQGGCGMEDPPASKCSTITWRDDVRKSVCDGIQLDGER